MPEAIIVSSSLLRGRPLPRGGDKEQRGTVVVVAGSPQMPGAAVLSATASLRAGAGKLQIGTCASIATQVGIAVPEALVFALDEDEAGAINTGAAAEIVRRANAGDAFLIGPGLVGQDPCSALLSTAAPQLTVRAVIDAAAMHCLRDKPRTFADHPGNIVITPHAGELATLLDTDRDEIEGNAERYALESSALFNTIVVLKGEETFIASPGGELYHHLDGDAGLGTCGSGDVLTGVIAGLLARGTRPVEAAIWGVFLHARAGAELSRRSGAGYLAREIAAEIPALMRWLA